MASSVSFRPARGVAEGSRVAVIAPSGPFPRAEFEAGLARLRERYEVVVGEGVYARHGFLAGDDDRRAAELAQAIEDASIDAIVCARGGYGATRILDRVDVGAIAKANKPIVGFSDVTALHAAWARAGVRSLHASMVVGLGRGTDALALRFREALEGRTVRSVTELEPLSGGFARGVLLGGNLAVLASLVGTPYEPPIDGAILFLEDVGERPYRIDRMLTHLGHAGWFARVRGVVLGTFTDGPPGEDGVTATAVLQERLSRIGRPVLLGLPSGHVDDNLELPLGSLVELDAERGTLSFVD